MKKTKEDIFFEKSVEMWKALMEHAWDESSKRTGEKEPPFGELLDQIVANILATVDFLKGNYKDFIDHCVKKDPKTAQSLKEILDQLVVIHREIHPNKPKYIQ